jgi:chromosome condensin MukBEF ATPase and DNA-binding subunit MukB
MAEKDDVILKIKEKIAKLDKDSAQSYKEQLKALNDSNAALGTYKNLLGDINTRIEDQLQGFAGLLKEIKGINEELENEGKHVRDATKAFRELESIASKLKNDQKGYTELNKDQLKQEQSKLKALADQARLAAEAIQSRGAQNEKEKAILQGYEDEFSLFERTNKLLKDRIKEEDKLNKKLGVTGVLLAGMSKIPIVGPLLKTNDALDAARKKAKAGGNAFQAMGAGLASVGKSLVSSLADPLVVYWITSKSI